MNMIQLREGPLIREDAITLAIQLESAGHTLRAANGALSVSPKVTDVRLRHELSKPNVVRHVVGLLEYCEHAPKPR